jgi:hypothetical protein
MISFIKRLFKGPKNTGPSDEEIAFIKSFMNYCSNCAKKHDLFFSQFLTTDLTFSNEFSLVRKRWLIKQVYYEAPLTKSNEIKQLYDRLVSHTIVFLTFLQKEGLWPTFTNTNEYRLNMIAICITVAEVTEEISFYFNYKEDIAEVLMTQCVYFALRDKGLLLKLASKISPNYS